MFYSEINLILTEIQWNSLQFIYSKCLEKVVGFAELDQLPGGGLVL